jgi:exosome complex RNA-binding protein Csl4
VRGQEVEIASVDGNSLTLKEPFALSVGWCDFKYRKPGGDVQSAAGRFRAEGQTVTSDAADFSVLARGDALVISSFVSQSSDVWAVVEVKDESTAIVKNVSSEGKGSAAPSGSAFAFSAFSASSTSSHAVNVTGGATIDELDITDQLSAGVVKVTGNTSVGSASNDLGSAKVESKTVKSTASLQVVGGACVDELDLSENLSIKSDSTSFILSSSGSEIAKIGPTVDDPKSLATKDYVDSVMKSDAWQCITVTSNTDTYNITSPIVSVMPSNQGTPPNTANLILPAEHMPIKILFAYTAKRMGVGDHRSTYGFFITNVKFTTVDNMNIFCSNENKVGLSIPKATAVVVELYFCPQRGTWFPYVSLTNDIPANIVNGGP